MVVESDVAELYNENIESFLLGACHDADTAGLYNGYEPNKKAYMDQVLILKNLICIFARNIADGIWMSSVTCIRETKN